MWNADVSVLSAVFTDLLEKDFLGPGLQGASWLQHHCTENDQTETQQVTC